MTSGDESDEKESSLKSHESQRSTPRSSVSSSDQIKLQRENSQALFETIKQQYHQQQAVTSHSMKSPDYIHSGHKQQQHSNLSTPIATNNPFKGGMMDKSGTVKSEEPTSTNIPKQSNIHSSNSLFGTYIPKKG